MKLEARKEVDAEHEARVEAEEKAPALATRIAEGREKIGQAIEAQRLWREEQERKRIRKEKALEMCASLAAATKADGAASPPSLSLSDVLSCRSRAPQAGRAQRARAARC